MGCGGSKKAAKSPEASKTLMNTDGEAKPSKDNTAPANVDVVALLNEVFNRLDVNGDGSISKEELSGSLDQVLGCSHLDSQKSFRALLAESRLNPYMNVFEQLDTNKDGKISREEFQENMHPTKAAKVVEQMLKEVFDRIDTNKDGNLNRDELTAAFDSLLTCSELTSQKNFRTLMEDAGVDPNFFVFEQLDADKDGKVTWEEFRTRLRPFDCSAFLKTVFDKLDSNGDGRISQAELTASFEEVLDCSDFKSKKSFRTLLVDAGVNPDFYVFEQLDTDHDGKITWAEFQAIAKPASPEMVEPAASVPDAPAVEDLGMSTKEELAPVKEQVVVEESAGASKTCSCI